MDAEENKELVSITKSAVSQKRESKKNSHRGFPFSMGL